ncbi:MAG TPA: hypothetical protein PLH46_03005 [Caldisericia bacterium]|nr:hypothetical protein [Caldisericia bacterium]
MFNQNEFYNLKQSVTFTRKIHGNLYLIGHDWRNYFIKGGYEFCFNLTTHIFTDEFIKENNL